MGQRCQIHDGFQSFRTVWNTDDLQADNHVGSRTVRDRANSLRIIASYTGNLDIVLHNIHATPRFAERPRKTTQIVAVIDIICCFLSPTVFVYALFCGGSDYDFLVAPLLHHIDTTERWLTAAKFICILLDGMTKQAMFVPIVMNFIMT